MIFSYNEDRFKSYDETYFVSEYGDVYSTYKQGLLKPYKDHDGYYRVDIHGKHMKIHKLVYLVWNGEIPDGMQVNHYDDNKENNYYLNLYLGTQKDNVEDCIAKQRRVGRVKSVKVYDKLYGKIKEFPNISSFLNYTAHPQANGSLAHCRDKKWFKERFEIIEEKGVETIESYNQLLLKHLIENKA